MRFARWGIARARTEERGDSGAALRLAACRGRRRFTTPAKCNRRALTSHSHSTPHTIHCPPLHCDHHYHWRVRYLVRSTLAHPATSATTAHHPRYPFPPVCSDGIATRKRPDWSVTLNRDATHIQQLAEDTWCRARTQVVED